MVLMWHLKHMGMLRTAMYYNSGPHNFRADVLEKAEKQIAFQKHGNPHKQKWYWFVRDPVARAISSYRHNLRYGYNDARISALLNTPVNADEGYSFNRFLDYLEAVDVNSKCDWHVRSQIHPVIDYCECGMINVDREDIFAAFHRIEADLQLPVTDFDRVPAFKTVAAAHHSKKTPQGAADESTVLNRNHATGLWPLPHSSLSTETVSRLLRIYQRDVDEIYPAGRTPG